MMVWEPTVDSDNNTDRAKRIAEDVRDGLDRMERVFEEDDRTGIEQVLDDVGGDIERLQHLVDEANDNIDRAWRLMENLRDRPDVDEVTADDEMIGIGFDQQTTLPEGFDEWADAEGLTIRDLTLRPETDGFVVWMMFADKIEALSPHQQVAEGLRPYFEAGVSSAGALDAWMTDHGPFSQTKWAEIRGVGRQTVSDRVRDAREQIATADDER